MLKRKPYWSRQIEICRALADPAVRTVLVPAGNGVGKSFLGAGLALWYLFAFPQSKVITTGPTFDQLSKILWGGIFGAFHGSELHDQATSTKKPPTIEISPEWYCTGINPDNIEAASGHHAFHLMALVDESSALTVEKDEAISGWAPAKRVYLGNPLRPDGPFYEKCMRATIEPEPSTRLIRIPSTESPAIVANQRRSPDGFNALDWLDDMRRDYGEDSVWWTAHVKAQFPDSAEGQVYPRDWIDRAISGTPDNLTNSTPCLSIDLAAGRGGDRSVILVRNAFGVLFMEASNSWGMDETANRAKSAFDRFNIRPSRVVYDHTGLGEGFRKYLEQVGIVGANGFMGGSEAKNFRGRYENLKSACAWRLRQRLDPKTNSTRFHIPQEYGQALRPELQAFSYELTSKDKIRLTEKDAIRSRIGRSPDLADALVMSFAITD